jgi:hypothetical protein
MAATALNYLQIRQQHLFQQLKNELVEITFKITFLINKGNKFKTTYNPEGYVLYLLSMIFVPE